MSEQPKVDSTNPERAAWHALSAYADKHNLGWAEFSGLVHAVLATPQAEPAVAEQAPPVSILDIDAYAAERVKAEQDRMRGEIAYQLTRRLVIDMPTARAAVDAALASQSTPPPESAGQGLSDAEIEQFLRAAKEALHHMCKAGCNGVGELDEAITDFQHACTILAANPTAQPDGGAK